MTATKTKVRRSELLAALEAVEPGLSPRDVIEQSSCVALKNGWVVSFNDELCIRVKGPLPEDLTAAVPGGPLLNAVRLMKDDQLEVYPKGGRLWVQGKRQRAYVRMESEITLPFRDVEKPTEWQKLNESFLPSLTLCQEFAGNDQSQFQFTCVHFSPDYMECCDNVQMLRATLPTGFTQDVLVRRNDIKSVAALGVTKMCETEGWVHFRAPARKTEEESSPEAVVSCRRYLDEYPSLDDFASFRGDPCRLPKELIEAAEFAGSFSKENSDDNLVLVTLEPGKMRVDGTGNTGGATQRSKLQAYKGERLSFRIAPKLLSRIAERYTECEVGPTKLRVDGGNWVYATVLGLPNQGEESSNGEAVEAEE